MAVRDEDIEWLRFVQNAVGAILSPFDSWLVLRGTKTLSVRMVQHSANGQVLAEFLAHHPKVRHVYYPGFLLIRSTPWRRKQMKGFGGMLSFELGSLEAARRLLNGVRLMSLAESLGGVETLISHPATMTHASVPVRAPGPDRDHRRTGPDLGGDRGCRRPPGRPRSGARCGVSRGAGVIRLVLECTPAIAYSSIAVEALTHFK